MSTPTLLAVPNVSEGQNQEVIDKLARSFDARLLDVHSDPDHHRSVFTLAGRPGELAPAVLDGARAAVGRIDLGRHDGAHPRIGAIDVAPIVYLDDRDRGAACAEALVLGDMLGDELGLPVFLYGELGGGRTRAQLRAGGPDALAARIESGELRPDFGPPRLHPTAGAVLVGARPPLVAFNVELAPPATLEDAKAIAAAIRESGPAGLESVRAIGVWLGGPQPRAGLDQRRGPPRDDAARRGRGGRGAGERRAGGARRPRAARGVRRTSQTTSPFAGGRRSRTPSRTPTKLPVTDGPDEAQASHQAPRNRRGNDRDARAHGAPADARGAQASRPARSAREARLNKPPTWKSSIVRALLAAVLVFTFLLLTAKGKNKVPVALGFTAVALLVYIPAGYYLETFLYRRRMRKKAATAAAGKGGK